ncbi:hypothetical protein [Pleionea litopenaei]|uniref:Uncharacterized protein n=1 Tax=Pleionea litopenaei TaxID=3070815 RepID=A0AA51RU76_9GAMM|nr:hypothetical protein [Pleionea sp. HL-JVS1]WMS87786.1 hypothetical protein Q9312_02400 [Pleionea sp. HL-JVS1]
MTFSSHLIKSLLVFCLFGLQQANATCEYDERALMALSLNQFDQDMNGGWRAVSQQTGCSLAAAELIKKYRIDNKRTEKILLWHEGQLRAEANQIKEAVELFKQSFEEQDLMGWNHYVNASIAFLEQDLETLKKERALLAAIEKPDGLHMTDPNGKPIKISWPPNLNVVDKLVECFGKSYKEAYSGCHSE